MTTVVPILDLNLAKDPATRALFLGQLKNALLNVGFLYIKNYDIPPEVFADLSEQAQLFFQLPSDEKEKCEMTNSPHFLGYTKLANEITAKKSDWREQIDLGTELPAPSTDEPIFKNLVGPNLWPEAALIPHFRPAVEKYLEELTKFSLSFTKLVAESIGLPEDIFDEFFPSNTQSKMKLICYPDTEDLIQNSNSVKTAIQNDSPASGQGCGPHRDSGFLTYIYQVTNHDSLQVYDFEGNWIKVNPIPNTLVVNVGQTLQVLSRGVCTATIHQVTSPLPGQGTRLSIPFFQAIDINSYRTQVNIPQEILQLRDERDARNNQEEIGFQFIPDDKEPVGVTVFKNRIKSHQDVSARWYPKILKEVLAEIK